MAERNILGAWEGVEPEAVREYPAAGTVPTQYYRARRQNLYQTRRADEPKKGFEISPSSLALRLAEALNKKIAMGEDTQAFSIAIGLAIFKDALDIGLMTAGGFMTIFLSFFLMYFLWGKGWFLRQRARILWWALGFFVDGLPLVSAAPINTIMVLLAWYHIRKDAGEAAEHLSTIHKKQADEIKELAEKEGLEAA